MAIEFEGQNIGSQLYYVNLDYFLLLFRKACLSGCLHTLHLFDLFALGIMMLRILCVLMGVFNAVKLLKVPISSLEVLLTNGFFDVSKSRVQCSIRTKSNLLYGQEQRMWVEKATNLHLCFALHHVLGLPRGSIGIYEA